MRLGVHVSISGSIDMAVDRAIERNCYTFQLFTRNPRGWKFKDLEQENVDKFLSEIIYGGQNERDVLAGYENFILSCAQRNK